MPKINIFLAGLIGAVIIGGWSAVQRLTTDPYFGKDLAMNLGSITPYILIGLILGGLFARVWNIFAKK